MLNAINADDLVISDENLLKTVSVYVFLMGKPIIGGVGFDINCGVRLIRTNLFEKDVAPVKVSFTLNVMFNSQSNRSKRNYAVNLVGTTHTSAFRLHPRWCRFAWCYSDVSC